MRKLITLTLFVASLMSLTSCATIFTGSRQNVSINSEPEGAKVDIDGIEEGVTPVTLKLKKGFTGQTITLKKEGFETKAFTPQVSFNAVTILNVFIGAIWAGVDAATGAMMKYDKKGYTIPLEKTKTK